MKIKSIVIIISTLLLLTTCGQSKSTTLDMVQLGEGYCTVQIEDSELLMIAHTTYEDNGRIVAIIADGYLNNSKEPFTAYMMFSTI